MAYSTTKRDEHIQLAIQKQQIYYELLPDWFEFSRLEHQYLRNKIGFALFGPPGTDETINSLINIDGIDQIAYDNKQQPAIDKIYNKIREFSTAGDKCKVWISILYVILVNDESRKSQSGDAQKNGDSNDMHAVPVFRTRKLQNGFWTTSYLDKTGRIYKDWDDYKNNNQLPKCTMVLPKNGYYQSNPTRKVTKLYSSVWVEVADSPACKTSRKILKVVDIASAVLSVGSGVGIGAATLLTPAGPAVVAAGLVSSCISGAWTLGRCSQQLADRSAHEESIVDKHAIPAWLGIAGSAFGVGANAGGALLPRVIAKGTRASAIAKMAFNSMVMGNLTVNGIGVAYQGCSLIQKYREKRGIALADILRFTTHVFFFSNAIVNAKLASGFISSTRGSIVTRFKGQMRFNRFNREYNRASSGTVNGSDLGIVRGVTIIQTLKELIGEYRNFGFELSKINISNVTLLDPMLFVGFLLLGDNAKDTIIQQATAALAGKQRIKLSKNLLQMLRFFCSKHKTGLPTMPVPSDFYEVLQELSHVPNAESILTIMFKVTTAIVINFDHPNTFLVDSVRFLWNYVKTNLREHKINASDYFKDTPIHDIIIKIVTVIHGNIESMLDVIFTAFYSYMTETKPDCMY